MEFEPYRLHGIEAATALVYGIDDEVPPLQIEGDEPSPRSVLEGILIAALQRPPCVVSFSGGRDSSAILALAAHLARQEGLAPPIAVTNVFPSDAESDETRWQEGVIRHLAVDVWERRYFTDEMDVLGPIAVPLLQRFGVTFPFNGHFMVPTFGVAEGGTYLTGVGGDELLEPGENVHLARILIGQARPLRSDLRPVLNAVAPKRLKAKRWRGLLPPQPWLRPGTADALMNGLASTMAGQRFWFPDQIRHDIWRERARPAIQATLGAFARLYQAQLVSPFQDPLLLRSVAASVGRRGWATRGAALNDLFGDVMPATTVRRRTKANFDATFFNRYSRQFVAEWDGTGVDTALVDVAALRETWRQPIVDPRSLSVLQTAWCATHSR